IQIARRVDQSIVNGNSTVIKLAFSFIELVNASSFITLNSKKYKIEPIIEELESNLGVFKIENKCVKELERFSSNIPVELLNKYVNALTQTYVGHMGASAYFQRTDFYADLAASIIPDMFEKFDDSAADAFILSIKSNKLLQQRIRSDIKLDRLRALGMIVKNRVSENYHGRQLLNVLVDKSRKEEFLK